jgi:hypothetical protein
MMARESPVDEYDEATGADSVIFGPSTANQRVESFWSRFGKKFLDIWKPIFIALEADGYWWPDDAEIA